MNILSNTERAFVLRNQLYLVEKQLEKLEPQVRVLKEQRDMLEMQIARFETVETTWGAIA